MTAAATGGATGGTTDEALVREIVTPEGIPLRFSLARAGDRAGAFLLDLMILVGVQLAIAIALIAAAGGSPGWLTAAMTVVSFLLTNFYFVLFEVRWRGSTPGKRAVGLRVIDARGGALDTRALLARNLVRELEVWVPLRLLLVGDAVWPGVPGWARLLAAAWSAVFLFLPLFNRDRLRVGDLIGGTRVVLQPKVALLPDLADAGEVGAGGPLGAASAAPLFTERQLGYYGELELTTLERVLRTAPGSAGRGEAILTVAERIRARLRYTGPLLDDEQFLRAFYAAQRAHLEHKRLLGARRADKHAR